MNFKNKDTYATGLVNPKTTALFFDKLWVPISNYHENTPSELLMTNINKDLQHELASIYQHGLDDNRSWDYILKEKLERIKYKTEFPNEYIFTSNRNRALLRIVETCKKIENINITPIFIKQPKLNENISSLIRNKLLEFEDDDFKELNELKGIKINALEVCIKNICIAIEEELNWKQVIEIRKDKKSLNCIRRLKKWINYEFNNKTENEIIESLLKNIDEYNFAMKKHGVLTIIGSLSTILASTASLLPAFVCSPIEIISVSLAISAGILTFTSQQAAEYFEKKREPIAFLYNINNMFNTSKDHELFEMLEDAI